MDVNIAKIDGGLLKEMIHNGLMLLERNKKAVDALNVFPVPDGDTGTNMSLTLRSAAKEVEKTQSNSAGEVAEAMSRGALKGARGNSGVILSQLFRGFYKGVQGKTELVPADMAAAFRGGVEMAYKAVMKPREGTVLTVSRGFADAAIASAERQGTEADMILMMEEALAAGQATLERTPEMLDVLKQAGVVDAGGKGLLIIYEGWLGALRGEEVEGGPEEDAPSVPPKQDQAAGEEALSAAAGSLQEITFGYCTEFVITHLKENVSEEDVDRLKGRLSIIGDSLVVVGDESVIKVHVHTNMPGKALQYALRLGELSNIKIDNMREQHRSLVVKAAETAPVPRKPYGMVTVAAGKGIRAIFKDLHVEGFVEGGQTMNPSTEDILEAVKALNADCVYVLPNNSNIIMAARQAAELAECEVHVIPTKTVPQGLAAVLAFNPDADGQQNEQEMTEAISTVKTGQVTFAVRDSNFDGLDIHKDDIMGMNEGKIEVLGASIQKVTLELVEKMRTDEEIITLYYGQDVSEDEALALRDDLRERYPDCDVEAHNAGQPLYYYILSLE